MNRLAGEYRKVERSLVAESRAALLLRIAVADRRRIVAAGHEGGRIFAERGVFGEVFRCRCAFFAFYDQLEAVAGRLAVVRQGRLRPGRLRIDLGAGRGPEFDRALPVCRFGDFLFRAAPPNSARVVRINRYFS